MTVAQVQPMAGMVTAQQTNASATHPIDASARAWRT